VVVKGGGAKAFAVVVSRAVRSTTCSTSWAAIIFAIIMMGGE